jgi:hypothetical protein
MDFLSDWKFWTFILGCINLIGIILVGIFNKLSTDRLTNNDLRHLSKDVNEIKEEQKCMKVKIVELSESVGYLKGKIEI